MFAVAVVSHRRPNENADKQPACLSLCSLPCDLTLIHLDEAIEARQRDAKLHRNLIKRLICQNEAQSKSAFVRLFGGERLFDGSGYDDVPWDWFNVASGPVRGSWVRSIQAVDGGVGRRAG